MDKDYLILKRASASRSSGEWGDDDFDVLADGAALGRIEGICSPAVGSPWTWIYYDEPAPVSLVAHKGGSNAEVMALHHCPRNPWVSRWRSQGCNGPN